MSIKAVVTTVIGNAAYANIAGVTTYATTAGVTTYAASSGIASQSSYAGTAGIATYAAKAGIATYAATAGIATYAATAGISSYSTLSGIATYSATSGISSYSTSSGTATYAATAGIATYASTTATVSFAASSGISTDVIGGIASVTTLNVIGVAEFKDALVISNDTSIYSPEPGKLTLQTGTFDRITINPYGSVGIGISTPSYTLSVSNSGATSIPGLQNCLIDATGSSNSYAQINIHNENPGDSASADVVDTADNGSDSMKYVDFGINNSGYNNVNWTINGANDGYLYASDGNLSIGVVGNKYVSFFTDGTLSSNERLRIESGGNVGIATTQPQAKLHVEGNARVSGAITATNGFTSGIGVTNPVKITVVGNLLTFTVAGVGSTTLQLF